MGGFPGPAQTDPRVGLAVLLAGGLLTAAIRPPMGPEQQFVQVERDFEQPEAIPAQNPIPLDWLLAPPAVYDTEQDNNSVGDRVGLLQTALPLAGMPSASRCLATPTHGGLGIDRYEPGRVVRLLASDSGRVRLALARGRAGCWGVCFIAPG